MDIDQDPHGFLPPTTDELHRQPPSSSTHHLPGFTALPLPQTTPATPKTTSDVSCIGQESDLASAIDRALFKIRDAVAAATTGVTNNPVRRTKSDITSSVYQKHPTTTATRHPLRRTVSDAITSPVIGTRKVCQSPRSRNTVAEASKRGESPQIKRLKKMKDMVTEIEERCRDFRRESEVQEDVGDDHPTEAIEEHNEVRELGFKQIDEGGEECIGFKRLDDGALRIQMHCSCRKHFEILHNHIGCFYRLI